MPGKKERNLAGEVMKLISGSGAQGILQKEIESSLGISKSYCSETVTRLEKQGRIIRKRDRGRSVTVYSVDFYPGEVQGVIRVGLLKSSEYIPMIALLTEFSKRDGTRLILRFYKRTHELMSDLRTRNLEFAMAPTSSLILTAILDGGIMILIGLASGGSGVIGQSKAGNNAILSTEVSSMISMSLKSSAPDEFGHIEPYDDPRDGVKRFLEEGFAKIAIWEPYFSELLNNPSCRIYASYGEIMNGFPCCSLATSRIYFDEHKDRITELVERYTSLDMKNLKTGSSYSKAVAGLARATRFKKEDIEKSLSSYDFSKIHIKRQMLAGFGISLSQRQEDEIFVSGCVIED